MSGNLRSRLARLRAGPGATGEGARAGAARTGNGVAKSGGTGAARAGQDEPEPEPGWDRVAPWLHARTVEYPLAGARCPGAFRLGLFSRALAGVEAASGEVAFFDLETTGLSGGTGVVAFLAGIGRIRGERLEVRQFFMADYPGEPAFVASVKAELEAASAWSTYNGASFDLPLLRTRCVMNGEKPPAPRPHADALYPARRLWRGALPDCSLSTVERLALGLDRGADLPGEMIPEAYFRYLREGPHPGLSLALEHNASDVLALALVATAVLAAGSGREPPLADPLGAAELQARLDPALAGASLEALVEAGDARAVRPLMRLYWKSGRRDERLALARFLPDDAEGEFLRSLWRDRVARDGKGALVHARRALELAEAAGDRCLAERAKARVARLEARRAPSTPRARD